MQPSTSIGVASDPREHGVLTTGGIDVSFSLELASPDGDASLMPRLRLKLTDEIRVLRDTGQEFVDLANRRHRPMLAEYYEVSGHFPK